MSKIIKHKLLTIIAALGLMGLLSGMLIVGLVSASHSRAATISLTPANAINAVGQTHNVTANVLDSDGNFVDGVDVLLIVGGTTIPG